MNNSDEMPGTRANPMPGASVEEIDAARGEWAAADPLTQEQRNAMTRSARWAWRLREIEALLDDPGHDPDVLQDERDVAASCAAYLREEHPERAAEIEADAARLGIDIAEGAARNAGQRRAESELNAPAGGGQVIS